MLLSPLWLSRVGLAAACVDPLLWHCCNTAFVISGTFWGFPAVLLQTCCSWRSRRRLVRVRGTQCSSGREALDHKRPCSFAGWQSVQCISYPSLSVLRLMAAQWMFSIPLPAWITKKEKCSSTPNFNAWWESPSGGYVCLSLLCRMLLVLFGLFSIPFEMSWFPQTQFCCDPL